MVNLVNRIQEKSPMQAVDRLVPSIFCWSKMGSEAGQPLRDIIRRKELERQAGSGTFAWGIGSSVGPAVKYAKSAAGVRELDVLFTPMKSAPKAIDVAPSRLLLWRAYLGEDGQTYPLPGHMLITSRGHSEAGEQKRGHYALICQSERSLLAQVGETAIDHRATCNLISTSPVGASQVTAVVRYRHAESFETTYPVAFRAKLTGLAFVRLVMPSVISGTTYEHYRAVCDSRSATEWQDRLHLLMKHLPATRQAQSCLF